MDLKNKANWKWMADHMPSVVALMREQRERGEGAVISECWRRGVLLQEPGFFYARENGVSVGVPSVELLRDATMGELLRQFPKAALLMLNGVMVGAQPPADEPAGQGDGLTRGQRRAREIVDGKD